jgi:hypothetical protein
MIAPYPRRASITNQQGNQMERCKRIALPGLIVAVMVMVSACVHTPTEHVSSADKQVPAKAEIQARVPNEYLVTLAPEASDAVITEYFGRFGIKYVHVLEEETFLMILNNDPGPQELEGLIQNESRIKVVQPNLIYWNYR